MLLLLMVGLLFTDPSTHRIPVTPEKWQHEDQPKSYMKGIRAVDTDGTDIFIADIQDPKVLQFKADGTFVRMIGGSGQGPSELGTYGPAAIAVHGPALWVLTSRGGVAKYYENGKFVTSFKPKHYIRYGSGMSSYRFDFDNGTIVLPTFPVKGQLARAYDYDGNATKDIGKELPRKPEFLQTNPGMNHTMWDFDGEHWYALFFHRPLLRKFDKVFNQVAEFTIIGPEIDQFEHTFFENKRDPLWTYPKPHFTDFVVFRNFVFALSNGVLYQIDKESGSVVSRTYYYAEEPYADLNYEGRLNTHVLTFVDDGRLFLFNQHGDGFDDVWIPESVPYFD